MEIYIDESGTFAPGTNRVCCVGALALASKHKKALFRKFLDIKKSWPNGDDELKGSLLSEEQIAVVLALLTDYQAIFEVASIILPDSNIASLRKHQQEYSVAILGDLNPTNTPETFDKWHKLAASMLSLSPSLFAQHLAAVRLVPNILQPVLYDSALNHPEELGRIFWTIDNKDKEFEKLYKELVSPLVLGFNERKPRNDQIGIAKNGDNSTFFKSYGAGDPPDPSGLTGFLMQEVLTRNLAFGDSAKHPGLQLADIALSAFSRAVNDHLQQEGWEGLGPLLIQDKGKRTLLRVPNEIDISAEEVDQAKRRYNEVCKVLYERGIPIRKLEGQSA